jgi:hypothetical protein
VPRSRQRESCRKAIFGAFHLACKRWGLEQTNGLPCVGKLNLHLTLFELILTSRQSRYLRLGLPADRLFLVCEAWRITPTEIISAHKAGANFVRVFAQSPSRVQLRARLSPRWPTGVSASRFRGRSVAVHVQEAS